jgi:hypothetical protein
MKQPKKRAPPKPRNIAAKSLSAGQFQPKVEPNPKAYKRRPKHKAELIVPPADEPEDK